MYEATQLASTTDHADREVDAGGDHDERLRHGDEREQHALVGGGLHDVGDGGAVKPLPAIAGWLTDRSRTSATKMPSASSVPRCSAKR